MSVAVLVLREGGAVMAVFGNWSLLVRDVSVDGRDTLPAARPAGKILKGRWYREIQVLQDSRERTCRQYKDG